jgi:carbon storage regulator CsrA
MLVLSRKLNEAVVLEHKVTKERIRVTVSRLAHSHDSIRLGFEAGSDWNIVREELLNESGE